MTLSRLALAALLALAQPLAAETPAVPAAAEVSVDRLAEVMQLDALFAVLREEGLAYGASLEADMFPSGGGTEWAAALSAIYDRAALQSAFEAALGEAFDQDAAAMDEVAAFFGSELGQRIVGLEIEARRAFLNEAAEEAARVAADDSAAARDPKVGLIRRMIEVSDLLEMNVAGSMSGSLAFTSGMAETGAYGQELPDDRMQSDVWGQEERIRTDTLTWLQAYLGLAYAPLSEAELKSYVEFWESPAGQRLNAALFVAFDKVFRPVSYQLGRAAGRAMQGRDI